MMKSTVILKASLIYFIVFIFSLYVCLLSLTLRELDNILVSYNYNSYYPLIFSHEAL